MFNDERVQSSRISDDSRTVKLEATTETWPGLAQGCITAKEGRWIIAQLIRNF